MRTAHRRCALAALVVAACARPASPPPARETSQRPLALVPAPRSAVTCPGAGTSKDAELVLDAPEDGSESFTIAIDARRAVVHSHGKAGLFYGAHAAKELAGRCITVTDAPLYPFRAMHLDVARHFFDRRTVERYLDLLAFYRFNVFHWHLTDDQGFRLRLRSHPELASADGSYSEEDVRHVVEYANARHIEVIPEIEMPGHSRAILAAHPELSCTGKPQPTPRTWGIFEDVLCAGNPASYDLVHDILAEVVTLFPSRFVHVGGDEVPPGRWDACPKCRAAMKAAGVDAAGLEHVFMERVFAELARLGKQPFVWDEALPPAPAGNAPVVVAWQSPERGVEAARRGFDTVLAPYAWTYFNFTQSPTRGIEPGHQSHVLTWQHVHAFSPGTGPHVRGGEGALWSEYVVTPADIETLVMPRMAALAEALWSGKRDDADFAARFTAQRPELDAMKVQYFVNPPEGLRPRTVLLDETTAAIAKPPLFLDGVIRYTRDGTTPTASSPRYRDPLQITDTTTVTTALFLPNGRVSPPMRAEFVKQAPHPPVQVSDTRASCNYYEGPFHRLADVEKATPIATVSPPAVTLPAIAAALGGAMKAEHFALACDAYLTLPATSLVRVGIKADDGLRITIDDVPVVEIDEERGPRTADGDIALAAGTHRVHTLFFQGTEGKQMDVDYTIVQQQLH